MSHNRQQTLNLLDDLHGLDDDEVLKLACLGPEELSAQTFPACFGELARRVNAWILLRHRPGEEFTKLSDHLVAISAQMDVKTVRRTLAYIRAFQEARTTCLSGSSGCSAMLRTLMAFGSYEKRSEAKGGKPNGAQRTTRWFASAP